uniref:Uncharacterized protein n=1 Tax=Arundo donax TaxID=35708 RepID=A0A0A9E258_ARUDO
MASRTEGSPSHGHRHGYSGKRGGGWIDGAREADGPADRRWIRWLAQLSLLGLTALASGGGVDLAWVDALDLRASMKAAALMRVVAWRASAWWWGDGIDLGVAWRLRPSMGVVATVASGGFGLK